MPTTYISHRLEAATCQLGSRESIYSSRRKSLQQSKLIYVDNVCNFSSNVTLLFQIHACSSLIQKFRAKVKECEKYKQQLKEVQTKLSIEEKGRMGLLAELAVFHRVSRVGVCMGGLVACEVVRNSAYVKILPQALQ